MANLKGLQQGWGMIGAGLVLAVAMAAGLFLSGAQAWAQSSPVQPAQTAAERIELLRNQIKAAEDGHAGQAEIGALWLKLGNRYQDLLDFAPAEDAFVRAARLLRGTETQAAYLDALDGLGSLYLATGREPEAEDAMRKVVGMYEAMGDSGHAADAEVTLALVLLFEKRYGESAIESGKAIQAFELLPQADASEPVSAYLSHSYALCYQGRAKEALGDTSRAMDLVKSNLPVNSTEVAATWLARGVMEWKSGFPDEGEKSIGEALRIVRSRGDWPPVLRVNGELGVLRQYAALLKDSHRKQDAKQIQLQIAQLQGELPPTCSSCTVNVAAVGLGLLP